MGAQCHVSEMVRGYTGGCVVCFQAEDGIRDLVRSRGLGDVYKRQAIARTMAPPEQWGKTFSETGIRAKYGVTIVGVKRCLLYTSDAADERSSVDLGGRRIIKKKNK